MDRSAFLEQLNRIITMPLRAANAATDSNTGRSFDS
jgi:hypothetical protein